MFKLSEVEKEVILLLSVVESIDSIINKENIVVSGNDPNSCVVLPKESNKLLFSIILVDFLSCPSVEIFGKNKSGNEEAYVTKLCSICNSSNFNIDGSINNLKSTVNEFKKWLNQEIDIKKFWSHSLDQELDLQIKRKDLLKICGNISKHNFTRLSGLGNQLKGIFKKSGQILDDEQKYIIIPEIYEDFYVDKFNYLASTVAEFLNNIRWGIYDYLKPEYNSSFKWIDDNKIKYRYTYPPNCNNELAQHCYWNLMNKIGHEPFVNKFIVSDCLKMRY